MNIRMCTHIHTNQHFPSRVGEYVINVSAIHKMISLCAHTATILYMQIHTYAYIHANQVGLAHKQ